MKILVASSGASSLSGFRLPFIKRLVANGHEVVASACENSESVREILVANGVRFEPIAVGRNSVNPLGELRYLFRLAKLMRRERFELVFLFQQKAVLYGGIAAKLARAPKVFAMVTGMGYAFSASSGLKYKIVHAVACALYRVAVRCFDGMIFQNPDDLAFVKNHFLKNRDVPVKRVYGSGIDLSAFPQAALPAEISFLFVGRLIADKGINEYVAAGKILRERGVVGVLKILGGVDTNPSAISRERLQEWEGAGLCKYLGKTNDVFSVLRESSVFVLPSLGEGTPRSALEAMSVGRPIITTNRPGCREVVFFEKTRKIFDEEKRAFVELVVPVETFDVRDFTDKILMGDNGFLVPAKNPEALATAMNFYLENPENIGVHGNESRRLAEKFYDVEKVNDELCRFMAC